MYTVPNLTKRTVKRFALVPIYLDSFKWVWLVTYYEDQILNGGKWWSCNTYLPPHNKK